jgi:hypothetical protein
VSSLQQTNAYLEQEFLPWWNRTLTVAEQRVRRTRPLTQEHDLAAILGHVEERQISNGYTVQGQYCGQSYQIPPNQVRTGMRGTKLRVERLDGSIAMRFHGQYLHVEVCEPQRIIKPKPPAKSRLFGAHARAVGCKASLSGPPCHWARPSRSPMQRTDKPQRRDKDRLANTARRSSRLLAQTLRSGDFTRMISRHQKTLAASHRRGSQPITPEPVPSHRRWLTLGRDPAWTKSH